MRWDNVINIKWNKKIDAAPQRPAANAAEPQLSFNFTKYLFQWLAAAATKTKYNVWIHLNNDKDGSPQRQENIVFGFTFTPALNFAEPSAVCVLQQGKNKIFHPDKCMNLLLKLWAFSCFQWIYKLASFTTFKLLFAFIKPRLVPYLRLQIILLWSPSETIP